VSAARDAAAGAGAAVGGALAALGGLFAGPAIAAGAGQLVGTGLAAAAGQAAGAAAAGVGAGAGGVAGAQFATAAAQQWSAAQPGLTAAQAATELIAIMRRELPVHMPATIAAPRPNPDALVAGIPRKMALLAHDMSKSAKVTLDPATRQVMSVLADLWTKTLQHANRALKAAAKDQLERARLVAAGGAGGSPSAAAAGSGSGGASGGGGATSNAVLYITLPSTRVLTTWGDLEQLWEGGFRVHGRSPPYPPLSEWELYDHHWATDVQAERQRKSRYSALLAMYRDAKGVVCAQHVASSATAPPLQGDALVAATTALLLQYHKCLAKPSELGYTFYLKWYAPKLKAGAPNPFRVCLPSAESCAIMVNR
jgi:hypothetical protein